MISISHITLGTNHPNRAEAFYDAVLATIGFARLPKPDGLPPAYQRAEGDTIIYICEPFDERPATNGNGSHVAFNAPSKEAVLSFHQKALVLGGSDEGAPGLRPHYGQGYFAAYVRDIDGNKLQAVCILDE